MLNGNFRKWTQKTKKEEGREDGEKRERQEGKESFTNIFIKQLVILGECGSFSMIV